MSSVRLSLVSLNLSFEQTLHRVQCDPDPSRTVSRDTEVQRVLFGQFAEALPFLCANGLVLDADRQSPVELARLIVESVMQDVG